MVLDYSEGQFLTTAEAAADLGVCTERVRQLDAELEPMRSRTGRRLYRAYRVAALAGERDAIKAARRARKASR